MSYAPADYRVKKLLKEMQDDAKLAAEDLASINRCRQAGDPSRAIDRAQVIGLRKTAVDHAHRELSMYALGMRQVLRQIEQMVNDTGPLEVEAATLMERVFSYREEANALTDPLRRELEIMRAEKAESELQRTLAERIELAGLREEVIRLRAENADLIKTLGRSTELLEKQRKELQAYKEENGALLDTLKEERAAHRKSAAHITNMASQITGMETTISRLEEELTDYYQQIADAHEHPHTDESDSPPDTQAALDLHTDDADTDDADTDDAGTDRFPF